MLDLRIRQLESIQHNFAIQQNRVLHIEQLLLEVKEQLQEQLTAKPMQVVDPLLAQQQFQYVQYLKMQVEHFRETLKKEESLLERVREEMRQAHVRKRSLELLEEKQRKTYIKKLEEQEAKTIEDLVISRYQYS